TISSHSALVRERVEIAAEETSPPFAQSRTLPEIIRRGSFLSRDKVSNEPGQTLFRLLCFLRDEFGRAPDRLPGRMATLHVFRVEAGLPQRDGGLAADMEAVNAEHHHRLGLRKLASPFLHEVRVAPGRAVHDLLLPRHGVPRASVDNLDRLAGLE